MYRLCIEVQINFPFTTACSKETTLYRVGVEALLSALHEYESEPDDAMIRPHAALLVFVLGILAAPCAVGADAAAVGEDDGHARIRKLTKVRSIGGAAQTV